MQFLYFGIHIGISVLTDYGSREERVCCLKSAKCFQNFPPGLDEFAGHDAGDDFDSASACR